MSESFGCLAKIQISEAALKKYFRSKRKSYQWSKEFYPDIFHDVTNFQPLINTDSLQKSVDFYAQQLYHLVEAHSERDVFIFNYNTEQQTLFIAIVYEQSVFPRYIKVVLEQLAQLAEYKDIEHADFCLFISPWTRDFYAAYRMEMGVLDKIEQIIQLEHVIDEDIELFFSFMDKDYFPSVKKALLKHNYYYKPLRSAYRRYHYQQEEIEKPNKIKLATKDNPYPLFGYFYSFDNKVYERWDDYREVEHADPFTLREIKEFDFCADDQYVYVGCVGLNYQRIDGIDGKTFTCLHRIKEEATYWKDKDHIYIDDEKSKQRLIRIEQADVNTFIASNYFGFARDKNHVYMKGKILPVDVKSARLTNNGFLFDKQLVYYYNHLVPLDGATFKILQFECSTNPHVGPFIVSDKTGLYHYEKNYNKYDGNPVLKKLRDISAEERAKIDAFNMWEIDF